MIRALTFSPRFLLRNVKEVSYQTGLLGEQPDLKGKELDALRRHYRRANALNAGLERPNFQQHINDLPTLQRNEIETRILRVFRDLQILDLKSVNFGADLRKDLKLDSLNVVALLTSIEHEFTTVLEDNVFEGIKNLDELITILLRDPKII